MAVDRACDGMASEMGKKVAENALDNPEFDPFADRFGLTAAELAEISMDPDADLEEINDGHGDEAEG
jgi:hypothetical protein